jgi:hypothetical protein
MKIAIVAGLFAEWNMNVNACHVSVYIANLPNTCYCAINVRRSSLFL